MLNSPANTFRRLALCCALVLPLSAVAPGRQGPGTASEAKARTSAASRGVVLKDVPEKVDRKARYLFFLHGKIVEDSGELRPTSPRYGVYEYEKMLDAFKERGFAVISEARAKDTDREQYASKVVGQIRALLAAGVPPRHVTVVGQSKGAVIAMVVSTRLRNRDVNFVLLDNCNDAIFKSYDIDLWGNVLSIYDFKDEIGQSCRQFFDKATGLNRRKEIELKIGTGHGILYQPLREWVEPTARWASR
ncbi:MAG TPA: hypothetical protein VJ866_16830 [Pyrinomonadaceae bacterium]|nr:hypothetical protein [Pyrinomonadaceae bacterium]